MLSSKYHVNLRADFVWGKNGAHSAWPCAKAFESPAAKPRNHRDIQVPLRIVPVAIPAPLH